MIIWNLCFLNLCVYVTSRAEALSRSVTCLIHQYSIISSLPSLLLLCDLIYHHPCLCLCLSEGRLISWLGFFFHDQPGNYSVCCQEVLKMWAEGGQPPPFYQIFPVRVIFCVRLSPRRQSPYHQHLIIIPQKKSHISHYGSVCLWNEAIIHMINEPVVVGGEGWERGRFFVSFPQNFKHLQLQGRRGGGSWHSIFNLDPLTGSLSPCNLLIS